MQMSIILHITCGNNLGQKSCTWTPQNACCYGETSYCLISVNIYSTQSSKGKVKYTVGGQELL